MEFHLAQIAYQSCVQFDFVYLAVHMIWTFGRITFSKFSQHCYQSPKNAS